MERHAPEINRQQYFILDFKTSSYQLIHLYIVINQISVGVQFVRCEVVMWLKGGIRVAEKLLKGPR